MNSDCLGVSFGVKDLAWGMGARWDANRKTWYVPSDLDDDSAARLRERFPAWVGLELEGENRSFGGGLYVDLIPRGSFTLNLRKYLDVEAWDRISKGVHIRAGGRCECCGVKSRDRNLDTHERFSYENGVQKLERLVGMCRACHLVTHFGFAKLEGKSEAAGAHLMEVTGWGADKCQKHIAEAFKEWERRSKVSWVLDLSLIPDLAGVVESGRELEARNALGRAFEFDSEKGM